MSFLRLFKGALMQHCRWKCIIRFQTDRTVMVRQTKELTKMQRAVAGGCSGEKSRAQVYPKA